MPNIERAASQQITVGEEYVRKAYAALSNTIDTCLAGRQLTEALLELLTSFDKYRTRLEPAGITKSQAIQMFASRAIQNGSTQEQLMAAYQQVGLIRPQPSTIIQANQPTTIQESLPLQNDPDSDAAKGGQKLALAWERVCGVEQGSIQYIGFRALPLSYEWAFTFDPSKVNDVTMRNKVPTLYSFIPGLPENITFGRRSGFVVLSQPREFAMGEFRLEQYLRPPETWMDSSLFPQMMIGLSEEGAIESVEADSLIVIGQQGAGAYSAIRSVLLSLCNSADPRQLRLVLLSTGRGPSKCFGGFQNSRWIAPQSVHDLPPILDIAQTSDLFRHIEVLEKNRNAKFGVLGRTVCDYNKDNPREPFQFVVVAIDDIAPLFKVGPAGKTAGHQLMDYVSSGYGSGIIYVLGSSDPNAGFTKQMADRCSAIFHLYNNSGLNKVLGRGKNRPQLRGRGDGILKYEGIERWCVSFFASGAFVQQFHQNALQQFPQVI